MNDEPRPLQPLPTPWCKISEAAEYLQIAGKIRSKPLQLTGTRARYVRLWAEDVLRLLPMP